MKVGNEATTESSAFVPSTTTEPIPTTFRRRRPKVKPLEIFDGVSITQINKRQKNVESVAEPDPIVRNQKKKKVTLQDVVLGTFENVNEKPKSIFTNFDKVQEALLGTITNLDKVQEDLLRNDESEFNVEPISIEQNNQIFDSEDMVACSIFDVSVPQKLEISTTPEPPITTVRFAMPETTTTQQRWIPPPTEAPRPVTLAPTQPPPIPVISATFAPVVTQPPQPPQQQQPIRQQVFQPVVTQPPQPPQQQQPTRQQVRSRVPQQRGPKNRVPKNRPLTKSEKLKQIQDRLKQLNSNGRWEKRNQRRKKLGHRVNLQEDGERFPTPVKAAALIKSEISPNQESSRIIVRKRRPNKQGDNLRPGQKIRHRRKKKPKFGNKLGVAA